MKAEKTFIISDRQSLVCWKTFHVKHLDNIVQTSTHSLCSLRFLSWRTSRLWLTRRRQSSTSLRVITSPCWLSTTHGRTTSSPTPGVTRTSSRLAPFAERRTSANRCWASWTGKKKSHALECVLNGCSGCWPSRLLLRHKLDVVSCGKATVRVQKAICSGFFRNAAKKDPQEGYRTLIDQQVVYIHPSSALFNRQPEWYDSTLVTPK